MFLNDPSGGLSTAWLIGAYEWWHNSEQKMNVINPEHLARHIAFYAAWFARVLNLREAERDRVMTQAVLYAGKHIQSEMAGILDRFSKADHDERHRIGCNARSWMKWRMEREEGRLRDFARVWSLPRLDEDFEHVEWTQDRQFAPGQIKRTIGGLEHLATHGNLKLIHTQSINQTGIVEALRQAGLHAGNLALVFWSARIKMFAEQPAIGLYG